MAHENAPAHGDRCSCRILASAIGCAHKSIRLGFCMSLLRKRWEMTCNHGCRGPQVVNPVPERWHGLGPIDAVKAVLIKND